MSRKKHQKRFLFTLEEANYYYEKIQEISSDKIKDYESKLLILNCLLESKVVRHYKLYKRNFNSVQCKSLPIQNYINNLIYLFREECTDVDRNYISMCCLYIKDWIKTHTIYKKENLSGPTR